MPPLDSPMGAMSPELGPPIDILEPGAGLAPVVVSSPHSGSLYPSSLLAAVAVARDDLRRLEDGCVDRLFAAAPGLGVPLLRARFARAYVDPNREAFELDPELFAGRLPEFVNLASAKARAGLGTIPSRIGGRPIYRARLDFAEAERRIRLAYWPYHDALQLLRDRALARFGVVLLLDCHSMPTLTANGSAEGLIDIALGDRYGRTCAPAVVDRVEALLRRRGLTVARNRPYAGGHITACYGRPQDGVHALQIEVRRGLYMDERTFRPLAALDGLRAVVGEMLADLADFMAAAAPLATAPAAVARRSAS
jgi:N-formylglutamate amidohydrolase